jgi:arylsulfatase A-like enzyme
MERLAREGLVFRQALSPAPWTLPSHASIFSGRLPTEHGITGECISWGDGRPTSPREAVQSFAGPWLPETLKERGYRTWAASCNGWVTEWGGFDRGFDSFTQLHQRFRPGRGRRARLLRRMDRLLGRVDRGGRSALDTFHGALRAAGSEPLFAFVNLMEVHTPYDPPRPFYPYPPWRRPKTRRLTGGPGNSRRFLSLNSGLATAKTPYVTAIRDLYYQSARYEDWLAGRFVEAVRERRRPTVVAVVADHGENLGEHGLFAHNSSLHETLLHVPLVLWGSGVEVGPGGSDQPVSLMRLPGWLEGLAEGQPVDPAQVDGAVASEYESTAHQRHIPDDIRAEVAERSAGGPSLLLHPGVAIRRGSLKYTATEDGTQALYDLATDPGEERNLLPGGREQAAAFLPDVDAWRQRRAAQPSYQAGQLAEEEMAGHLRDLGYID